MSTMTIRDMVRPWGTEAEQVRRVAGRWHAQYRGSIERDKREIYESLLALAPDATAADVAAIIGNDSWVGNRCTFCGEQRIEGFDIGEPADYESHTVYACRECAAEIARLVTA